VRCLTSFEETVEAAFHLTFAGDPDRGGDVELHREDLEVETLHGETLDLAEIVREQLYLALRPHPVCKDACQGLCPECGADRNALDCGCARRSSDPRFAVLENWAQRGQNPVQGRNRQR
jgi:uncharacterized protein